MPASAAALRPAVLAGGDVSFKPSPGGSPVRETSYPTDASPVAGVAVSGYLIAVTGHGTGRLDMRQHLLDGRSRERQAEENRAYVRHLLRARQPEFQARLEAAVRQLDVAARTRDDDTAFSERLRSLMKVPVRGQSGVLPARKNRS
jgi:hypothetical protein